MISLVNLAPDTTSKALKSPDDLNPHLAALASACECDELVVAQHVEIRLMTLIIFHSGAFVQRIEAADRSASDILISMPCVIS